MGTLVSIKMPSRKFKEILKSRRGVNPNFILSPCLCNTAIVIEV